jgi:hypothetical protein
VIAKPATFAGTTPSKDGSIATAEVDAVAEAGDGVVTGVVTGAATDALGRTLGADAHAESQTAARTATAILTVTSAPGA